MQIKNLLTGAMLVAVSAGAALAADLPSRVAPPVYVPPVELPYSWTGFEAGLHSAYTFGSNNHVTTQGVGTPATDMRPYYVTTVRDKFAQVGAGFGYNYQFTPGSGVVLGVSADADWVDMRKDTFIFNSASTISDYHQRLSWLGTANGHLGYAFGRFLVYGAGGFAFGDPGVGANFLEGASVPYYGGNRGNLRGGYDFGGGAEYAIPNDSFLNKFAIEKMLGIDKLLGVNLGSTVLKAEYIHYDLGNQNVTLGSTGVPGYGGSYNLRFHTEGNQVRAGLLYSFASTPTPVVARY